MKISKNSETILSERYLLRDKDRKIIETPSQLFRRVAKTIAEVEVKYGKSKQEIGKLKRNFYGMMAKFEFLPNSPTLMNAGTDLGQLSACFVLPVLDDIEAIFDCVKQTAMIHKSGGGTGYSFTNLRPKNDVVKSTGGIASGPLSFMRVFDIETEVIKQGGKRRGAMMGILRVDHPDIVSFIGVKKKEGRLKNFNLSVAITDEFMNALLSDGDYNLVNPRKKRPVASINAQSIFTLLATMSWSNGEPAVIFIDRMNATNPTPELGEFEATNPCGETPLLNYESCNLGSINLSKFVNKNGRYKVDWNKLGKTIRLAVRFLDDVIDANKYPLEAIKEATLKTRKIGLGVMGWADMLVILGIQYDSQEAVDLASKIMKFIQDEGKQMSRELAQERGNFPTKDKSIYKDEPFMRNATITTIAPTGTISIIANCSQSIEPIFAHVYKRNVKETLGKNLLEINPTVKYLMKQKGYWNLEIEKTLATSDCPNCIVIPKEIRRMIPTALTTSPEWQIKMQAAFQKYTDNAVSKTVNLPNIATVRDIENIYVMAYKLGCKGITVYRDGSRIFQLLEGNNGSCPTCPT